MGLAACWGSNQLGRRNLIAARKIQIVLELKPLFAARAKAKQRAAGGAVIQKSGEPSIRTDKQLAKLAGVSHDTFAKGEHILESDDEETKARWLSGELSTR